MSTPARSSHFTTVFKNNSKIARAILDDALGSSPHAGKEENCSRQPQPQREILGRQLSGDPKVSTKPWKGEVIPHQIARLDEGMPRTRLGEKIPGKEQLKFQ